MKQGGSVPAKEIRATTNVILAAIYIKGMDAAASHGHAGQREKERHQQPRQRARARGLRRPLLLPLHPVDSAVMASRYAQQRWLESRLGIK